MLRGRQPAGRLTSPSSDGRATRRSWIRDVPQDVRYAFRALRRSPGYVAVAVLSLAIGIGATTSIFSVIRAVDLRSLPFADADRLVELQALSGPSDSLCSRCPLGTPIALDLLW